jgi:isopentenyldiphosphate isomerase
MPEYLIIKRMEFLDVLNGDGSPTGQTLSRKEVHQKGLWHRAAHIWIINSKGELLLQKRSLKKESSPGMWDISAAGHLSAGETRIQGAIKEIGEELGLTVNPEELIFLGETKQSSVQNNGTYFNNQFSDVYLLKKDLDVKTLKLQESEVDEIKYIAWKELKTLADQKDSTIVPHPHEYPMLFEYLSKTVK